MQIITVTPNVAIDETVTVDRLIPGTVHRAQNVRFTAGGKGVNVSSCLADWGLISQMSGFVGEDNALIFDTLCRKKNIDNALIRVPGLSRTNIKLVDEHGTTDINLPGAIVCEADVAKLFDKLDRIVQEAPGIIILSGSLPQNCPEDLYTRLVDKFTELGFKVVLDTAEAALERALAAPTLPFCIKPNRDELAHWAGSALPTLDDVIKAAAQLHQRGIGLIVVSLGEEGALFLSDEGILSARATATSVVSTTGAGDAMVAGIVAALAEGGSLERIARLSTAFAVAKLGILGPNLPAKAHVEALAQQVTIIRRADR